MPAPTSALRHYRRLQRLQIVTLLAVRRAWSRLEPGSNWEQQYAQDVGPKVTAIVVAAQIATTRESDAYIADVLNELAFGPVTKPGVVIPTSLAGVAGDGRPVESLLATSVGRARAVSVRTGGADADLVGLQSAQSFMDTIVQTILADVARATELAAMVPREWVDGYVRMISPPCCSRCAILSGKFYLFKSGFERHPNCDCYHVPAPSDPDKVRGLISINSPERYFESLTEEEQNQIFTKDGAEAIRLGADMTRVVNARRGMSRAQDTNRKHRVVVNGRSVYTTTAGTTRRGRRSGQTNGIRLMPESILEIANGDRAEAIRLLRLHGYI